MRKPNQIVDEITGVVYPPKEAIVDQLSTIRAIIGPTIKIYESTGDVHSIFPNLEMIQTAIDYLRGQPELEDLKPVESIDLELSSLAPGLQTKMFYDNKANTYNIDIMGVDVIPKIHEPELFGDMPMPVTDISLVLSLDCSKEYIITQQNPALAYYYGNDENVIKTEEGLYIKSKKYKFPDEDKVTYSFLLPKGQSNIVVTVNEIDGENFKVIYNININAHVHFKAQEDEGV